MFTVCVLEVCVFCSVFVVFVFSGGESAGAGPTGAESQTHSTGKFKRRVRKLALCGF